MTNDQWNILLEVLDGRKLKPLPIGFIIDSPWLPGWYGISTLDYYTNGDEWYNANVEAISSFEDVMFLPGFWSEYGMCTEPSAFGSKLVWNENNLPHAEKVISSLEQIDDLNKPNVKSDGLLPLVIKRLLHFESHITNIGHSVKFAISRGPLNIASFLMGTSEFLTALLLDPNRVHRLLSIITEFINDWLDYQIRLFPTIEGVFILDDIVGFVDEDNFKSFVVPYIGSIFSQFNSPVKFFHNDADGRICATFLEEMGINLFNFSFNHSFAEMRGLAGEKITLLGNIPPRDVLAKGNPEEVQKSVLTSIKNLNDKSRIIMSCGGGMPPHVPSKNINAFIESIIQKKS